MIPWLEPGDPFPPTSKALREPDGLLCAGADLSVARLCSAYRAGIFPWFSRGQPPLWWAPDPRCVFGLDVLRPNARLRRDLRRLDWQISADTAFAEVMQAWAQARDDGSNGWITPPMCAAYSAMHAAGYAHSVEVWTDGVLIGGVYGIAIDGAFFAESMFSRRSNASKVALMALAAFLQDAGLRWLDAQVPNAHTLSLGASEWPRRQFEAALREAAAADNGALHGNWQRRYAERGLGSALALAEGRGC